MKDIVDVGVCMIGSFILFFYDAVTLSLKGLCHDCLESFCYYCQLQVLIRNGT